jgi:arylsulfatase A-like enzyme
LLDFLRTLGKPDNTLTMVISDNGATIAAALRQAGG